MLRALWSSPLQAASLTESVGHFRNVKQGCPADNVAQVDKVDTWIAEQLGSENTYPFKTVSADDTGQVRESDVSTWSSLSDTAKPSFSRGSLRIIRDQMNELRR